MKTNVTCSLDSDLVARLDAWRAPMGCGRSHALELLLEGLPEKTVLWSDVCPKEVPAAVLDELLNGSILGMEPMTADFNAIAVTPVASGEDGFVAGSVAVEQPTPSKKKHK